MMNLPGSPKMVSRSISSITCRLRGEDALARAGGREDPQGHAARPGGAHRVCGADRVRRRHQHGQRGDRSLGGDNRLRRRRSPGDARRGCCGAQLIVAVDIVPEKLELARAFGATHVIDATDGDPVDAVIDLTDGGVEYSFEALGLKETAEQAFRMLRVGGVAIVIGMVPENQMMEVDASELLNEKTLRGSNMESNHSGSTCPISSTATWRVRCRSTT